VRLACIIAQIGCIILSPINEYAALAAIRPVRRFAATL
jgi:hypothetical protein